MPANNTLLFSREIKKGMILHWLSAQDKDTHTSIRMFYACTLNCPVSEIPTEFEDNQVLDFVWMIFEKRIKTFHKQAEKQRKFG